MLRLWDLSRYGGSSWRSKVGTGFRLALKLLEEGGGESFRAVPGTARVGEDERVNRESFSYLTSNSRVPGRFFRDHLDHGRSQFRSRLRLILRYETANMVSSYVSYRKSLLSMLGPFPR